MDVVSSKVLPRTSIEKHQKEITRLKEVKTAFAGSALSNGAGGDACTQISTYEVWPPNLKDKMPR